MNLFYLVADLKTKINIKRKLQRFYAQDTPN